MKRIIFILSILFAVAACTNDDFKDAYPNPSKVSTTSVEKQFAGFLQANSKTGTDGNDGYVVPSYWNYFVVLRPTIHHYTQATGWVNANAQYVPGAGLIQDRWNSYYNFLAQFRELENVYNKQSTADKTDRRIFMIAATIYLYDHTQKVIDLHGDIPFSKAGMLSANGGNYSASLPAYDNASTLYTKMLDDLKGFADELNSITVPAGILTGFNTEDFINKGNLNNWKVYCNSLRLRMLTRVSGASSFQSRASTEIASILNNPSAYPTVTDNAGNIQISVYDLSSPINAKGFKTGLEDWNGNIAGKVMIDNMVASSDPRLRVMFEPGANATPGTYQGLDPLIANQQAIVDGGTLSIYNRSTLSRNQYFPGVLINAAEVYLLKAEYYLGKDDAQAKAAYNNAIAQSINQYFWFRSISNDNTAGTVTPLGAGEIATYQAKPAVSWDLALTTADKLKLIATQKWIHYSVVQPYESWSEIRRLKLPALSFQVDNTNAQTLPPSRFLYANSELVYNTQNYSAVKATDNLTTKLFWDVK